MTHALWYRLNLPALAVAILLAFPVVVQAVEPGEQRPCMDELEKFCKDVQPGEGRIIKCLQEHDRDLSAVCRDKVQSILNRLEDAKQACAPDIGKFCPNVVPGGGRLIKCLTPHFEELTPACKEKAGPILRRIEKAKKSAS
jgi:cysteine rich repeat protein